MEDDLSLGKEVGRVQIDGLSGASPARQLGGVVLTSPILTSHTTQLIAPLQKHRFWKAIHTAKGG